MSPKLPVVSGDYFIRLLRNSGTKSLDKKEATFACDTLPTRDESL
jgi:hypothetical protein